VGGVLHVCTANRCRSAIAELMMRMSLPDGPAITSAGTYTRGGEGVWPGAAMELERLGVATSAFVSRRLEPAMVADADLVLTATREHRDQVVATSPAMWRRVFTWRELAWLLHGVQRSDIPGESAPERLRAMAATATSRRGQLVAPAPGLLDVPDPVDGPPAAVVQAVADIQMALRVPIRLL
jgi:protein-tyrosine phosphatase